MDMPTPGVLLSLNKQALKPITRSFFAHLLREFAPPGADYNIWRLERGNQRVMDSRTRIWFCVAMGKFVSENRPLVAKIS